MNGSSSLQKQQVQEESDEEDDFSPLDLHGDLSGMDEAMRNCLKNSEITDSSDDSSLSSSTSSLTTLKRSPVLNPDNPLLDEFVLNALLAIRTSALATVNENKKGFVSDEDFTISRKYKISMAGDKKTEVKDFAPIVFQGIRKMFGINTKSYLMSWSDSNIEKSKSAGKSASSFVFSPDRKFILKTLSKEECLRMRKLLIPYFMHLESCPETLLSRIFGLHRMCKWRGQGKIYFAVFNNVFDAPSPVKTIYDLKGSSVGRRAGPDSSVLKDLDLQDRKLYVTKDMGQKLKHQIEKDCQFLRDNDLMDYSLLVGIRKTEHQVVSLQKKTQSTSTEKVPRLLYFIESAKAMRDPEQKGLKVSRRKSLLVLPPNFFSPMEQRKFEEEEEEEDTKGDTNSDSQNGTETTDAISASEDNNDDNYEEESPQQANAESPPALPVSEAPNNNPSVTTATAITTETPHVTLAKSNTVRSIKLKSNSVLDEGKSIGKSLNIPVDLGEDQVGMVPLFQQDEGGIQSVRLEDKEDKSKYYEIYYIGIIDFLQKYNKKKKLANFAKSFKYDKEGLSTVDPTYYMNRFLKMVHKVVGD